MLVCNNGSLKGLVVLVQIVYYTRITPRALERWGYADIVTNGGCIYVLLLLYF